MIVETSYNLGQNCWENSILGQHFSKHHSCTGSSLSPSPESNVVVYSKESLIPGRLWEATLNWGKGFSFRKGVILEIVLLRRKVDMMGETFSSSFVRDCSPNNTWLVSMEGVLDVSFWPCWRKPIYVHVFLGRSIRVKVTCCWKVQQCKRGNYL